jgi:hypothetical protein
MTSGVYTSAAEIKRGVAGAIPTFVVAFPFRVMVLPIADRSAPKRRFHRPSLIMATGVEPGFSSSSS